VVLDGRIGPMSFQFRRSLAAPGLARRALAQWLDSVPCPAPIASDAQLVVSELTANAVVHAHSAPTVVASFDDGRLRIEVHDQHPTLPHIRDRPGPNGGWGLRLVAASVDGWGSTPTSTGKHVWAELLC
jgi:anti-sigma regulatory factor (Ser/Thr protein kinase)